MTPLLVAALATQLHFASIFHRAEAPVAACGITTVSYRFTGAPGAAFRYDGENYVIPASGSIELLASRRTTDYELAGGRHLPLDVWPRDDFGTRIVPVGQQPAAVPQQASITQ